MGGRERRQGREREGEKEGKDGGKEGGKEEKREGVKEGEIERALKLFSYMYCLHLCFFSERGASGKHLGIQFLGIFMSCGFTPMNRHPGKYPCPCYSLLTTRTAWTPNCFVNSAFVPVPTSDIHG